MKAFLRVKLISPAIIGGAYSRKIDNPPTLRIPEIRGQLRFWMRALTGGAKMSILDIKKEERALFGGTESGVKLVIFPPSRENTFQPTTMKLFPHKEKKNQAPTSMIQPFTNAVELRFNLDYLDANAINKLKSVFWVWLHLGSIGRRARRGFGSLLWFQTKGDFLEGFVEFNEEQDLARRNSLENYLRRGLESVRKEWGIPSLSDPRTISKYFCLPTIDQVFVGEVFRGSSGNILDKVDDSRGGIIEQIHGLNKNTSGDHMELGHTGWLRTHKNLPKKLASPIMWHLFPCGNGYIPVLTWSPYNTDRLTPGTDVHNYIVNRLGFRQSLMGRPM